MIKKYIILLFIVLIAQCSFAQSSRTIIDFNKNRKFLLGNDSAVIDENYNDAGWRTLNLPHDWSIEGAFSETNPATTQGGARSRDAKKPSDVKRNYGANTTYLKKVFQDNTRN
jgi:beta-galactosidase